MAPVQCGKSGTYRLAHMQACQYKTYCKFISDLSRSYLLASSLPCASPCTLHYSKKDVHRANQPLVDMRVTDRKRAMCRHMQYTCHKALCKHC